MNKYLLSLLLMTALCAEDKACPPILKQLVLSGKREISSPPRPEKEFISSIDTYVPDQKGLVVELSPYQDKEIDEKTLSEIKQKIINHYQKHGRPLIVVEIPPQDATCGTVQFWIMEATIGKVSYTGGRWYSDSISKRGIRLEEGGIFDEHNVLNDLAWLNRNPFHQTEILLSPGEKLYTTDAEFKTFDRFPLRPYAGTDNTGTESTGPNRMYVGANVSIPCMIDHVFTYQYTAAYNPYQFQSQYANLLIFLPCKQELSVYGGYAVIHPKISGFHHEGRSWQASFRHDIPLLPLYETLGQEIQWGVDFKSTNNNLFFTSATEVMPASTSAVMLFQVDLNYQLTKTWDKHELYFFWENYCSPGDWLPDQSVSDYNELRPGARPLYYYTTVTLSDRYRMPKDFLLTMEFRGQVATNSLLPSEQFGLGGLYTVRGYEEREINVDNALLGNIELSTPPLWKYLRFVAFVDAGGGWNYHSSSGEEKSAYLIGVGPGARFNIKPYLTARVDYGFKLHQTPFSNSAMGRWHFSVMASY